MADLSTNKQAFFDYEILKKFEAGLILYGFEAKSIKLGRASLRSSFIFFRDAQKWGRVKMDIKDVLKKASDAVKQCDAILVEATEKANGAYFEAGYAKALGKKVIIIHKKGTETNFLDGIADISIEYEDFQDLREKLKVLRD